MGASAIKCILLRDSLRGRSTGSALPVSPIPAGRTHCAFALGDMIAPNRRCEIFQDIALLGLWRGKFFEHAAFYGGTCLRILYGLGRFSEDMDFSLLRTRTDFDLAPYCRFVEEELSAWGFKVTVTVKKKTAASVIESAFLKADTKEVLLTIETVEAVSEVIQPGRIMRIRLEVDTQPPGEFNTVTRYLLQPVPFAVRSYALPDLFAGKMHALLFRKWKQRVKGRDWYDLVWYVGHNIPLNLLHLKERMRQSGDWGDKALSENGFCSLLRAAIDNLDIDAARYDVNRFLKHPDETDIWSKDFFMSLVDRISFSA